MLVAWARSRSGGWPRCSRCAAVALERAAAAVQQEHGRLDVAWGELYRLRGAGMDLPADGTGDPNGVLRATLYQRAADGRFVAVGGDSWVAAVEFGDRGSGPSQPASRERQPAAFCPPLGSAGAVCPDGAARFPHPYTRADAEWWVQFAVSQEPETNFAIEIAGEAVGGIGVTLRDDIERVAVELGYWLGQPFWGRGVMTVAVRAMTQYAFETFPITRVYALPYAHNDASIRVLEKCGYMREGVLRRHVIKDGVVQDQVVYALTDEDLKRTGESSNTSGI